MWLVTRLDGIDNKRPDLGDKKMEQKNKENVNIEMSLSFLPWEDLQGGLIKV